MSTILRDPSKAAEVLDKAAGILEANGVTKGNFSRERPGAPTGYAYCALGAMREAADDSYVGHGDAIRALQVHIAEKWPDIPITGMDGSVHIPSWNDARNRKPSTIIKAFRDAAEKVRQGVIR